MLGMRLMECFVPLRQYRLGSVIASAFAVVCSVYGAFVPASLITALLFSISGALLYYLWTRPAIEVNNNGLTVGNKTIRWHEIGEVETTGWHSPLVVRLTLHDGRKMRLIHPGDVRSSERLLQRIRRNSREAMIDGEPYREFWGETAPIRALEQLLPIKRPRLLREEDEHEVEELFRQLREIRQADHTASSDENFDA